MRESSLRVDADEENRRIDDQGRSCPWRLLDLFSGAGGAAMGYCRAGFINITGIDNRPMKRYPFKFIQADAFEYLTRHGREFDVIHASPPCQAFTALKTMWNSNKNHKDLLTPCRDLLLESKKPYVIENVYGAPLISPVMLCGTAFHLRTKDGLGELRRHRYFESSIELGLTPACQHNGIVIGVYGGHGRDRRRVAVPVLSKMGGNYNRRIAVQNNGHAGGFSRRDGTEKFSIEERREAMGIDWMSGEELSQAIPPAYTEWIGKQLLRRI